MTTRPAILIPGATDGLGSALAHPLAAGRAALILHGRDHHERLNPLRIGPLPAGDEAARTARARGGTLPSPARQSQARERAWQEESGS